jgi:hypothetical protein
MIESSDYGATPRDRIRMSFSIDVTTPHGTSLRQADKARQFLFSGERCHPEGRHFASGAQRKSSRSYRHEKFDALEHRQP